MYHFAFILLFLGVIRGRTRPRNTDCPSVCRCEGDERFWRTDCVDLSLTSIPSNLSVLTTCLDLSMNNLTLLPGQSFSDLRSLQELRLAGNGLTDVPKDAFAGLVKLKVLTLQNNHLKQVPSEALENLRNLRSLRLDANFIVSFPATSLGSLTSLHHLWLDDNALSEVPVGALSSLPALQAVTLALNYITHIPDRAFQSLGRLVVLHLHDNQIHSLGDSCFDGLNNLETLDLSSNRLETFPTAVRVLPSLRELTLHNNNIKAIPEYAFVGNPSLETINLQNNPVEFIGQSAFQKLPALHTLSLSGATDVMMFPDLTGTNSLETLSITDSHLSAVPSTVCETLPNLQHLDLTHNRIHTLPNFSSCRKLQKIDLGHNFIREVQAGTFQEMKELRSLDLTSNQLSSLSLEELKGLTHLKLAGNPELTDPLALHLLPQLSVAEMPFAFQCCVLVPCENYDPEGLTMDRCIEARPQPSAHCSPAPGPRCWCQNPVSWLAGFGVWLIFILSIIFNFLILVSIFFSSVSKTSAQHLLHVLFWFHSLTGLSGATLAAVDIMKADHFGAYAPRWERGAGLGALDFLFRFFSEACVFLVVAAVFEHRLSGRGGVQVTSAVCCTLALAVTALPHVLTGEVGPSSRCMPFCHGHSTCWGYNAAPVLLNSICYLLITVTHASLFVHREEATLKTSGAQDRGVTRLLTFLLLTNCLLSVSEAVLCFSSVLRISSLPRPEVADSAAFLTSALPACLDPLLYMFLSPHFRQELIQLFQRMSYRLKTEHTSSH